jgi:hypothetical protein
MYFAFDRGGYRFLCLNSYDLPHPYRTARVKPFNIELHEWIVPRFNILNWGGAIQRNQLRWFERFLRQEVENEKKKKKPLLFIHHCPRGSYAVMKEGEAKEFGFKRRFPITFGREGRNVVQYAPRWDQTQEIHEGKFTPIRLFDSSIRARDWFEAIMPPPSGGHPGWIRFQQGWHAPYSYSGGPGSAEPFAELEHEIVDPLDLLQLLADFEVRAVFKGHDNNFGRRVLKKGDTVVPAHLALQGEKGRRERIARLRVKNEKGMTFYHVADIADPNSDGHGYFLVRISGNEIEVRQVDHF